MKNLLQRIGNSTASSLVKHCIKINAQNVLENNPSTLKTNLHMHDAALKETHSYLSAPGVVVFEQRKTLFLTDVHID